eukprot:TRINITY_DN1166_c0_g1_i2.p1 TRINITY_DN1166_c0_g1~~TRINITY_DN1166_c0_g1_i2.p1  ORF type:complete len:227 (+),score=54.20 TRINITY_DN1166_c0_g1_i2:99-779(+)
MSIGYSVSSGSGVCSSSSCLSSPGASDGRAHGSSHDSTASVIDDDASSFHFGDDTSSSTHPSMGTMWWVQLREAVRRMCTRLVVPGRPLTSEDKAFVEFGQDISYDPCSQAVAFVERSGVHPIVVLVGLYYLARIRRKFPSLSITTTNASRLMLVAWSSAAKYVDDRSYRLKNKHWVKIGGGWLSLEKFNKMEMEFMSLLEYNLSIDHDEFNRFCRFCGVSVDLGW